MNQAEVQEIFRSALDRITDKLRSDNKVIAAFVGGSLSYDQVWEKSDIDMTIVVDEDKRPYASFMLVENGICISANVTNRQNFKQNMERSLQTGFFHSYLYKSTMMFCHDAAIKDIYDRLRHVGERDLDIQLIQTASWALTSLEKAEKWIVVKRDPVYSFVWLMKTLEALAQIEVMLNLDIPTREVIQQALKYNPEFFRSMYSELIEAPKTIDGMTEAVRRADNYLAERHERLFKLVYDYLREENDIRSFSEMMQHLKNRYKMEDMLIVHGCEWLAQKGYIHRASSSLKLTPRSRIEVEELAYFDGKGFF
ncbi:hypothetical protein DL346_10955 [Paenibacillus montanisoli]|uniref:Polymerase beta nucleotidyltransferase domain-containing protein n=2 Tax=Paenibacillus montanisoli TaxID=2081970 RepID=A0A328TZY8_9BACL|nr:hypothetical protein DL346_10955 [Paenibacillus montanisoli]